MIKGIRIKPFETRGTELAFIAYNDARNKFPHNSPTIPMQYKSAGEDYSNAWADAWRRGEADRIKAIAEWNAAN
mgnify:CR=1 FL=1